ncbi:hypothetical protein G1H11_11740 [Phytoactinopolyspora alkaliphila]|uniref:MFS transporter n=1 Tax=Phytoactinopolyspora alkaliphila TaxID=1783498 RepID=A0A6N9YLZ3_9ACTN|nr:hypothetical protein [Phytoactinopolyspora alkaliphila]NED95982.1 hypothetical protein [Phytoactinopolyspora alkaliphila]
MDRPLGSEDEEFWGTHRAAGSAPDLIVSIFAEHLGFSVWLLWSITATMLVAHYGFDFSAAQLFFLVAVPNVVGSMLRIPCTFACRGSADGTSP